MAFPCSILQFFLLLQNRRHRCPPPTCSHFVTKHQASSYKKNSINPWKNSRPSFTKSTSLPTTTVEKKERKKNEWCYLLLTYVLHCKKKQGQVHQTNAVKAEPDWPPICVSASSAKPTFSKFFVKTSLLPAIL